MVCRAGMVLREQGDRDNDHETDEDTLALGLKISALRNIRGSQQRDPESFRMLFDHVVKEHERLTEKRKRRRHLWVVPVGALVLWPFRQAREHPRRAAALGLVASTAAAGLYVLGPDAHSERSPLPEHAAPWKPDYPSSPRKNDGSTGTDDKPSRPAAKERGPREKTDPPPRAGTPVRVPEEPNDPADTEPAEPPDTLPPVEGPETTVQCLLGPSLPVRAEVRLLGAQVLVSLCTPAG